MILLVTIPNGQWGNTMAVIFFSILVLCIGFFGFLAWAATMLRDVRVEAQKARPRIEEARATIEKERIKERIESIKANRWEYSTTVTTEEVPSAPVKESTETPTK